MTIRTTLTLAAAFAIVYLAGMALLYGVADMIAGIMGAFL